MNIYPSQGRRVPRWWSRASCTDLARPGSEADIRVPGPQTHQGQTLLFKNGQRVVTPVSGDRWDSSQRAGIGCVRAQPGSRRMDRCGTLIPSTEAEQGGVYKAGG